MTTHCTAIVPHGFASREPTTTQRHPLHTQDGVWWTPSEKCIRTIPLSAEISHTRWCSLRARASPSGSLRNDAACRAVLERVLDPAVGRALVAPPGDVLGGRVERLLKVGDLAVELAPRLLLGDADAPLRRRVRLGEPPLQVGDLLRVPVALRLLVGRSVRARRPRGRARERRPPCICPLISQAKNDIFALSFVRGAMHRKRRVRHKMATSWRTGI